MSTASARSSLFLLALSCLTVVRAGGQVAGPSRARAEIGAANTRFVTAYNAGDVAQAARVYSTDATILPANSAAIHGRPAIEAFWQGGWKMGIRNVKLTTTELEVRGNAASEVGQYAFDIEVPNAPASHDQGKYIVLWKRSAKDGWQWDRDIFNSDMAPASAQAPARGVVGDTVRVIVNHVRADKRDQFERFLHEAILPAMTQSAPTDTVTARQLQRARLLRPLGMDADSTYAYVFLVDPIAASASYSFPKLLAKVYGQDKANEDMRLFREALARPQDTYVVVNAHW